MTMDDAVKGVVGFIIAAMGAVLGWFARMTLGNREKTLELALKHDNLEVRVAKLEREQLTPERCREIFETVLDKRDVAAKDRRSETQALQVVQLKQSVAEEMERIFPKLVHELRGLTPDHGTRIFPKGHKGHPPA